MSLRKFLSVILIFGILTAAGTASAADNAPVPDAETDSLLPDLSFPNDSETGGADAAADNAVSDLSASGGAEADGTDTMPDTPADPDLSASSDPKTAAAQTADPAYLFVTPSVPAAGKSVAQFLQEDAAGIPNAWVCSATVPGDRIAPDALVSTGMWLMSAPDVSPVRIIVWGDVLGLGKVDLRQLVRMAALLQSPETADACVRTAGDTNQDGSINLVDLCAVAAALPAGLTLPSTEKVTEDMRAVDVLAYVPESTYPAKTARKWDYKPVLNNRQTTLSLPGRYSDWLQAAAASLHYENITRIETDFRTPSWPLLASIALNYKGDPNGMRDALCSAVRILTSTRYDGGDLVLTVTASPVDPNTLFYSRPASSVTNAFLLSTSYAYLSTLYDDSMTERKGIGTPVFEPLLFPIAYPSRYYVGDCWLAARDSGARKHTGTDINAPQGTNLLACVNGTIIGNGYDAVGGNYIVLQGSDGTQYHYYHLVRLSGVPAGTQVRRGDVIGHVGSTGNSRANHLHFTIVTAGGQYVNSFPYLLQAQSATINGAIRPA